MRHIIIGFGEVGAGLHKVIGGDVVDPIKGMDTEGTCDMLHVCIPHSELFYKVVTSYQERFKPSYTVIHSTVPIGTSASLGAHHSPVRGVHPNIDVGILTFVKFVSGPQAEEVAKELNNFGIKTRVVSNTKDTEAGKIWSTTQYGFSIILNKLIYKWCQEHGVDFDIAYKEFNKTYNDGYMQLGRSEVVRPYLNYVDGEIGGHCVIQNLRFLENEIVDFIKQHNS